MSRLKGIYITFKARKCVTLPRSLLELGISCRLCRLLWNSRSVASFHKKEYCVFWTGLECSTLRFLWHEFKVLCYPAPHFFEHWSSSVLIFNWHIWVGRKCSLCLYRASFFHDWLIRDQHGICSRRKEICSSRNEYS